MTEVTEKPGQTGSPPVSIAEIPFENFSGGLNHDYFSSGFVEDLSTDLAHFANLQVISSYTTRKMAADSKDALSVAGEFDIDYLLKGNLRRLKGQVRISAQLLETAGGRILWGGALRCPGGRPVRHSR